MFQDISSHTSNSYRIRFSENVQSNLKYICPEERIIGKSYIKNAFSLMEIKA